MTAKATDLNYLTAVGREGRPMLYPGPNGCWIWGGEMSPWGYARR